MRTERQMFDLILTTAQADERIRAVILNGSRANPNVPRDIFQDFDIVYIVTDLASFRADPHWIDGFGERMILQTPDDMGNPSPETLSYAYLMQFMDGNRIDLTLFPASRLAELQHDSLSLLLLDKDNLVPPFPPANDSDYLPQLPTAKAFAECCNEFWWVCPYVAKGLWRGEIIYAKAMLDGPVRDQLMQMLMWFMGVKTSFTRSPGKWGKYLGRYLEPEVWGQVRATYADADVAHNWEALRVMGDLFRRIATQVATHFGFEYPAEDDARVSAYLRQLPPGAAEMD
jgi:aminoglycoside 6-adenylyltransferase